MIKPRLYWSHRYRQWVYFASLVRGQHDRMAEKLCADLNVINGHVGVVRRKQA
jgi:hypothetical protein